MRGLHSVAGLHQDPGPLSGPMTPQPSSGVEMNKNLSTSSKCEGLHEPGPIRGFAAAMAAELMISCWFGIGAILAIKMVSSLECCMRRKC